MKIKTTKHGSQLAHIHKDKNKKIIVRFSEIETGITEREDLQKLIDSGGVKLEGKLEMATAHELELLKEASGNEIKIPANFICLDDYQNLGPTQKQKFWNTRNDRVSVSFDTGEHILDGQTITIEELIRRNNLNLL